MPRFELIVEAVDKASDTLTNIGKTGATAADTVKSHWLEITAVGTTLGGGLLQVTGRADDLNAGLRRVATESDATEKELRDLVLSLTDATFSNDDAVAAMERLQKSQITSKEQFEALLPIFDDYADATGKDIVKGIDEFDRVLSALNIPLEDAGEHLDTLTFLSERTTADMGSLGQLMRREAPALKDMGLSVDDIAVAMASLEAEGRRGPRAVMGFQEALADAEGDAEKFWQALGVSNDTLETQQQRLTDSAGLTKELAGINNASISTWNNLTKKLDDVQWIAGSALERFKDLGPVLIGIGPAIKGVSMAKGVLTKATWLLNTALLANPIFLIIVGLIALGVALVVAYKKSETFRNIVNRAWSSIKNTAEPVIDWFIGTVLPFFTKTIPDAATTLYNNIKDRFNSIRDTITNAWNKAREVTETIVTSIKDFVISIKDSIVNAWITVKDFTTSIFNSVKEFFLTYWPLLLIIFLGPIGLIIATVIKNWETIKNNTTVIFNAVKNFLTNTLGSIRDFFVNIFNTIWGKVRDIWDTISSKTRTVWEWFKNFIDSTLGEAYRFYRGHFDRMWEKVSEIFNRIDTFVRDKLNRIRDTITGKIKEARDTLSGYWDDITRRASEKLDALFTIVNELKNDIKDALLWPFRQFRDTIAPVIRAAGNKLLGPVRTILDGIKKLGDGVKSVINWIGEKLDLGSIISGDAFIPTIPELAKGGRIARGGLALVGEKGRELVNLPGGASVIPNRLTESLLLGIDGPGFGGNFVSRIVGGATDIASSAFDTLTDWLAKGAKWVVEQAFNKFNLSLNLPGVLSGAGSQILSKVKDMTMDFVSTLLSGMEEKHGVGDWVNPTTGAITQLFGRTPFSHNYASGMHTGIDIANSRGTAILASNAGTISRIVSGFPPNTGSGYGNYLSMDHSGGYTSLYAHLNTIAVRLGQVVAKGQQIATMDNTGFSTGDHLHFEIRRNNDPVDPSNYIKFGQGGMMFGLMNERPNNRPEHIVSEQRLSKLLKRELDKISIAPHFTVFVGNTEVDGVVKETHRRERRKSL